MMVDHPTKQAHGSDGEPDPPERSSDRTLRTHGETYVDQTVVQQDPAATRPSPDSAESNSWWATGATLDGSEEGLPALDVRSSQGKPGAPPHRKKRYNGPMPPDVVAERYALEVPLGQGGCGTVFRAKDRLTGGMVAIKILSHTLMADPLMMRREALAMRMLGLPGVVRVLDEGETADLSYLVMELVEGTPFPGRGQRPWSWETLQQPARALLETLARVHAAGLIHRDLKPSNVLVTDDGKPVVLDFGLASGSVIDDLDDAMVGTPAYLAPEQVQWSGRLTVQTDLYAVGVMLYEALSGKLPYQASSHLELVMLKSRLEARPLGEQVSELPDHVAQVIDQMLSIAPGDRPRSAVDVLQALEGERWATASTELPWIGPTWPRDQVLDAIRTQRPIDLYGPRGSGRTRCLSEAQTWALSQGRAVCMAQPSTVRWGSLGPSWALPEGADPEVWEVRLKARLQDQLTSGWVLLLDDPETIDPDTWRLVEQGRMSGAVVRVVEMPPIEGVSLPTAWSEAELRDLFVGPDWLFHLREDSAHELHRRTGGEPRRVCAEIMAWLKAGLARWSGDRLALDRAALHRLRGRTVRLALDIARLPDTAALSRPQCELLAAITLAWPHTHPDLLSALVDRPEQEVHSDLKALEQHALIHRQPDGRYEALQPLPPHGVWSDAQQRIMSYRLAELLEPGTPERLVHIIAAEHVDAIVPETLVQARRHLNFGQLDEAIALLSEGFTALRHAPRFKYQACDDLLSCWTDVAIATGTASQVERVLYEISRVPMPTSHMRRLHKLV
ncbi:MAG: serine/threonine-protein kinase, partial [Myxococcota bacterium]